jgi:hypothetical protein
MYRFLSELIHYVYYYKKILKPYLTQGIPEEIEQREFVIACLLVATN